MKTKHLTTFVMACLLMVGALAFVATNSQAAEGSISGTVSIECAVEVISNGGALAFGFLAAPGNGNDDVWTMSPLGGNLVRTGSGDGTDFFLNDHSVGTFKLKGSEPVDLSIAVSDADGGDFLAISDIVLSANNTVIDLNSPFDLVPADCATPVDISVGGTLTVSTGAVQTTGIYTVATITLTANY